MVGQVLRRPARDPGRPTLAQRRRRAARAHWRALLADELARVIDAAARPGGVATCRSVPVSWRAIRAERATLEHLCTVLRSPPAVHDEGLVALRELLTDASSPVYREGDLRGALGEVIRLLGDGT